MERLIAGHYPRRCSIEVIRNTPWIHQYEQREIDIACVNNKMDDIRLAAAFGNEFFDGFHSGEITSDENFKIVYLTMNEIGPGGCKFRYTFYF